MKTKLNILFLAVCISFFTACNNASLEGIETETLNIPDAVSIYDLDINEFDLSDAQKEQILTLASRKDYNISLQATANWGHFSSIPENAYTLVGKFPKDLTIELPTGSYNSTMGTNNMVYVKSEDFEPFYGSNLTFSLENSETQEDFSLYVPKKLQATKLSPNQSMAINRGGDNIITWEADANNELGVVLLSYTSKDNASDPLLGEIVEHDILVLQDDGEFDINSIIQNSNQKSIQFSLYRGNAVVFDGDVLFSIISSDIHLYTIEDL